MKDKDSILILEGLVETFCKLEEETKEEIEVLKKKFNNLRIGRKKVEKILNKIKEEK